MSIELFHVTEAAVLRAKDLWENQIGEVELDGPRIATFYQDNTAPSFVARFRLKNHRLGGSFTDSIGRSIRIEALFPNPEIFRERLIAEGFVEANEVTESYKTLLRYLDVP